MQTYTPTLQVANFKPHVECTSSSAAHKQQNSNYNAGITFI